MSYFVVERGGDGGGLRIPLSTAYETREAAIAALSAATSSGEVTLAGEVFIADLGSAVPVLVMTAAAPVAAAPLAGPVEEAAEAALAESVEEVEADAGDALPESVEGEPGDSMLEDAGLEDVPGALDADSADGVYASWAPIEEATEEGSSLADALKRAATTLEDEGVVAPDSVLTAPLSEEQPGEELAEPEEILGDPPIGEVVDEAPEPEWPWSNVESYQVPAQSAESVDEEVAGDVFEAEDVVNVVSEPASVLSADTDIAALVESLGEDAPIITSAPAEGEEVYVPKPVILGDYGDGPTASEFIESDESMPQEAAPAGSAEDPVEVLPESGYAPAGDLDLAEYTCQDCVYSNTCPKVGQVTPAECGSFQWKSE